jgi:(5-formylfuran-3-yl)methyl phosphate synthase
VRLLVSVRSGAEVAAALAGGADIIDAKEPARGSLGAVDGVTLAEIAAAVPPRVPLSVALGDLRGADEVERAIAAVGVGGRWRSAYLKAGFAGVSEESQVRLVIRRMAGIARTLVGRPQVVAVAYADHRLAVTLSPTTIAELAAEGGATGVLLDTWTKDGRSLFDWISPSVLKDWVNAVRSRRLLAAVAGSLHAASIPTVLRTEPDIVGIRGAACDGGRSGVVSPSRVRAIRSAIGSGPTVVNATV